MKTIQQIWDETPRNEAIKDKDYLLFSDILVFRLKMDIYEFCRQYTSVWELTAEKAISIANRIVTKRQEELEELARINRAHFR